EYDRQVRAARRFLEGKTDDVLDDSRRRMDAAAAEHRFEQAARRRDQLDALVWLRERLARIDEARRTFTFVYPVGRTARNAIWHIIVGGRIAAVVRPPRDTTSMKNLVRTVRRALEDSLDGEHTAVGRVDSFLLVMRWFRSRPEERDRTFSLAEIEAPSAACGLALQ
ncbi:MAG: hypothetical protein ACREJB_11360, partial [Planctomycetaceae bacterium]